MASSGSERAYLTEYLAHAPVALALLRAIECRELSALEFQRPVLDVGCGDGLFGQIFFGNAPEAGLDHSLKELRTAVERGGYRALVQADVGSIPFQSRSFATVFANGVLEHVRDLPSGLSEVCRVLRPGGHLIFTVPTMEDELQLSGAALLQSLGFSRLSHRYADAYNRAFGQVNLHDVEEWRLLLADEGLELVHHRFYAPARVFRLHDLTLPLSVPSFACKRLTGRWTLWPGLRRATIARLWAPFLEKLYLDRASPGCSLLMVARARE